jgi:hypothetical protein
MAPPVQPQAEKDMSVWASIGVGFQDLRSYPAVQKFHIIMDAGYYYAYGEV